MTAASRGGTSGTTNRNEQITLAPLLRPDEVAEQTGLLLPESDDYETIAGLVHATLGRIADRGDEVELVAQPVREHDGEGQPEAVHVRLTVERMQGRRIERLVLTREDPA